METRRKEFLATIFQRDLGQPVTPPQESEQFTDPLVAAAQYHRITTTNHYLTIELPDNKVVRAQVTYLQPKAQRTRRQTARICIVCGEWIETGWYSAIYVAEDRATSGKFMPTFYEMGERHGWAYTGIFERED